MNFNLQGNHGPDIFATSYPRSQAIVCAPTALVDGLEPTVTIPKNGIAYNPTTDQYTYVWKTDQNWANTCRHLVVKLKEGSVHRANFIFN